MQLQLKAKKVWPIVSGSIFSPDPETRPVDFENWVNDYNQAQAWINSNGELAQRSHLEDVGSSYEMWERLKKVHETQSQGRINHLMRRFWTYKAGASEIIDEVASELTKLRMLIRNIDAGDAPSDRGIALTLINAIDNEAYNIVKYHLEAQPKFSLEDAKEQLKSVEQKLIDETSKNGKNANKTGKGPRNTKRKCHHCNSPGHIKFKCFKWLATDEGKKYTKIHPKDEAARSIEDPTKKK